MKWHLAEMWEAVADAVPDAPAVVNGAVRRTWREYEDRAARIAAALAAAGHGPGSKVGVYAYNSNEFLEAYFAAFKIRGTPVNVNYRYTEGELVYLLDNADAEALVFDAQFGERVQAIRERLPKLKTLIEIDDGSGRRLGEARRFEDAIAAHAPLPRQDYAEDDIFMIYTGGTTGMPKGVMSRQGDRALNGVMLTFTALGLPEPATREAYQAAIRQIHQSGQARISLVACPLMHGTGLTGGAHRPHLGGGCAVTLRDQHFDAEALWTVAEREKVTHIAIVGDSFARPMLSALEAAEAAGRPFDLSSLKAIFSAGVMFSREMKEGLLKFADITINDAMAATEGAMAASVVSRAAPPGETAKFVMNPTTKVFDENDQEIEPGSDKVGMIANGGAAPVGYYKDPEKSAHTFRVIDGHRYSFPGDFAKVAADGSLILLGRGSNCINTGGEKVFPEEVEEALKAHPAVEDCLVVGVPDARFGQRITAVLSLGGDRHLDQDGLLAFVRMRIAGYKAPRRLIVVDEVRRAANGKADYAWANMVATQTPAG
ncbi:MAG: AMP-binding protein [Caulobacterales bacterium]